MRKLLALLPGLISLVSPFADASSHREAPFVSKYPQVDSTDFYAFASYEPGREDHVTLIANYLPLQSANGGPNYFPLDSEALYEIMIDKDGDAREDLTFQFRFSDALADNGNPYTLDIHGIPVTSGLRNFTVVTPFSEPGLSHQESYTVTSVTGDRRTGPAQPVVDATNGSDTFRKPFDFAGVKTFGSAENYESYARSFIYDVDIPACEQPGRVFVGQRNEAFKIALGEVFDLVNFVPIDGASGYPGGVNQDPNRNTLARQNVTSIALELHKDCITDVDGVIGTWTSASLRQATILNPSPTFEKPEVTGGAWTQVSRLASPLINELIIGYDRKDKFNASEPVDDAQYLQFFTHPTFPAVISNLFLADVNAVFGTNLPTIAPENFPRNDLVTAFLTGFDGINNAGTTAMADMLRLDTSVPATPRAQQSSFGYFSTDFAGFPNGRRPGDDVVDISLRVLMGALCHDQPLGPGGTPVNLGLCNPTDAVIGLAPFTDGVPLSAAELEETFPYLLTPYPGSPVGAPLPTPIN